MIKWLVPAQAFLLSVAYVPGIVGAATSPRWAVAALSAYFMTVPALLFSAYAVWALGIPHGAMWAVMAAAFCLGRRLDGDAMALLIKAFAAGITVNTLVALFQLAGFEPVFAANVPAGLFINKNLLGEAAAVCFVLALRLSVLAALTCLPAVLMSGSRASLLAVLLASGIVLGWKWRGWALCLVTIAAAVWLTGRTVELVSLQQRLWLWGSAVNDIVGVGWFGIGAPLEALHNEFLQAVFELGAGALVPFAIFVVVAARDPATAAGFAAVASFGFPLHVPATAWLIAVGCGYVLGVLPHDERNRTRSARREGSLEVVPDRA